MFELGSAVLAGAATATLASASSQQQEMHDAPNETDPGPRNLPLAKENSNSVWPPETDHGAAFVTLKPGGLRELHWHPNADEWQYYITGKGRMAVFIAGTDARTMDFEEGDVGYIPISNPHYIENTGDSDLVFLEMFKSANYRTSR